MSGRRRTTRSSAPPGAAARRRRSSDSDSDFEEESVNQPDIRWQANLIDEISKGLWDDFDRVLEQKLRKSREKFMRVSGIDEDEIEFIQQEFVNKLFNPKASHRPKNAIEEKVKKHFEAADRLFHAHIRRFLSNYKKIAGLQNLTKEEVARRLNVSLGKR